MTLQAAVSGAGVSAPETAVVRLASLLPERWTVHLDARTASSAEVCLIAPEPECRADAVEAAVDEALAQPELRGWARVRS
ncbi:hypothetical protein AB0A69_10495 [Streptomyces sp. NPDC045431]|uniref:hypothetical protein n=1 Tax=Streptomyces sp. NPDC045431 TaxID=3155613 RepID=UPI0033D1F7C8